MPSDFDLLILLSRVIEACENEVVVVFECDSEWSCVLVTDLLRGCGVRLIDVERRWLKLNESVGDAVPTVFDSVTLDSDRVATLLPEVERDIVIVCVGDRYVALSCSVNVGVSVLFGDRVTETSLLRELVIDVDDESDGVEVPSNDCDGDGDLVEVLVPAPTASVGCQRLEKITASSRRTSLLLCRVFKTTSWAFAGRIIFAKRLSFSWSLISKCSVVFLLLNSTDLPSASVRKVM